MGLPYRLISAISLVGSYLLSSRETPVWPITGFIANFITLWAIQLTSWVVWIVILYPKVFSPLRHLPEPNGGSWHAGQFYVVQRNHTGVPMLKWMNTIPNNGLIRYLWFFNQERLLVTTPAALAEVLVTKSYDFEKPSYIRWMLGRILGVGVLVAEGDVHKTQRRKLLPAFAFRHTKDLYPVFWAKAQEGVRAMTKHIVQNATIGQDPNTGVIEVGNWASRVTLDIIGVAGLGHDFGAIRDPGNELNQTYQHLFKPSKQQRILNLLGMFLPSKLVGLIPVQRNGDMQSAAKFIRGVCARLIEEKKQKLARKELVDLDILSVALESGGFSDENLIDQLMTFLAAGHETTASAMTWAVYLLSRHKDVQDRLRAEIRDRLPPITDFDGDSIVTSTDIDHMPYLNAVCNEVLRYFSPVPLTLRQAVRDTNIQGEFVPKGTSIVITPWAINKAESMWGPDGSQFNPDRWIPKFDGDKLAGSGGATSNYAFMTFLHGPRSCIGQSFAKAEFACLLAAWVGRFSFELVNKEEADESKLEIRATVTVRPAHGLHIKTTVVEGW